MNFFEYCCVLYYMYRLVYGQGTAQGTAQGTGQRMAQGTMLRRFSPTALFMGKPYLHPTDIPICHDCVFFQPVYKKHTSSPTIDYARSVCNKFSKISFDSDNNITYTPAYAIDCREQDHPCGIEGTYFYERPFP